MVTSFRKLVNTEKGVFDRTIISSQEIYDQELEQIFGRCWLFLGHETLIPKANDFFAMYMGEDPVIVNRDTRDRIHVFLNMCRHRGNRICRADEGNSPSFMCTYHGWTFASDGKLVGVPGYKEAYFEELDRSQWGLVEAAKIETYHGLIFATWDKEAPSLLDYLGDMTWHMDMCFDRSDGGIEILKGSHKWMMGMNWKFPTDNHVGDSYHVPITHGSVIGRGTNGVLNAQTRPAVTAPSSMRVAMAVNGHGVAGLGPWTGTWSSDPNSPVSKYNEAHKAEFQRRLGPEKSKYQPSTYAIFPNFVISNPAWSGTLKVFLPRGPLFTLGWSYYFVDKHTDDAYREVIRRYQILMHGPSGIMESDDALPFLQATGTARGTIARRYPLNQQLGLGHEFKHEEIPGMVAPTPSEIGQRGYYDMWAQMMDAPSWSHVRLSPRTKAASKK